MFRHWLALASMALMAAPGWAQYRGPGSVGAPLNTSSGFYGRPGAIGFGVTPRSPRFVPGTNYKPGYPYPYGYGYGIGSGFAYGNPYLNYYSGYATPGIYYAPPVYYPDYDTPPSYAPPPPATDQAKLPPATRLPAPDPTTAYIDFFLPEGSKVWAQGVEMPGKSGFRRFITPSLEAGHQYSYEFHILVPGEGKEAVVRHISVAAGDRKSLRILDGQ